MQDLLDSILDISIGAGREILNVYESEFSVDRKEDGSPLTMADRKAHARILSGLRAVTPEIPVLSEESDAVTFESRKKWRTFWLIDPLDGTREFIKRNDEFTVNIALIENGAPVLGVVHAPVKKMSHYAARGVGAYKVDCRADNGPAEPVKIGVRSSVRGSVTMAASRSHSGKEVEDYRHNLEQDVGRVNTVGMGSSLKICLVAEGMADIYPRLGPTSEWDTAAAHCILEAAGGSMINIRGEPLRYNKPDILNPWFLACGDNSVDWTRYVGRS